LYPAQTRLAAGLSFQVVKRISSIRRLLNYIDTTICIADLYVGLKIARILTAVTPGRGTINTSAQVWPSGRKSTRLLGVCHHGAALKM
jgi:hypothetical protein